MQLNQARTRKDQYIGQVRGLTVWLLARQTINNNKIYIISATLNNSWEKTVLVCILPYCTSAADMLCYGACQHFDR